MSRHDRIQWTRKFIWTGLATLVFGVSSMLAQDTRLLGSARRVLLQSDCVFNKNRAFNSGAIPFSLIYRSGLMKGFQEVDENPEIIIKFHKDVYLMDQETITLTIFDADSNSVIYSEERKLVDEGNDVNHLVAHFLAKVNLEREARAAELRASLERDKRLAKSERDSNALRDAQTTLYIYSPSEDLLQAIVEDNRSLPNLCHVYLRQISAADRADVVLTEKVRQGNRILVLLTADTKEVLHTEPVRNNSIERAMELMSRWITSTPWE